MLNNLSYKDLKIEKEINTLIGKEYSFLEKLIRRGIGSKKLIIKKADNLIYDKLSKSYDLNECNIEIRSKGIIIYFKSHRISSYVFLKSADTIVSALNFYYIQPRSL